MAQSLEGQKLWFCGDDSLPSVKQLRLKLRGYEQEQVFEPKNFEVPFYSLEEEFDAFKFDEQECQSYKESHHLHGEFKDEWDNWYQGNYYIKKGGYNKHGCGLWLKADGTKVEGIFKKDKFVKGRMVTSDSLYQGEVYHYRRYLPIKKQGFGFYHYPDGRTYTGEWLDDNPEGKGLMRWPNGTFYNCTFYYGGQKWGDSCLVEHANGQRYEGPYRHDMRNGYGVLKDTKGNWYEGFFWNDQYHGQGTKHLKDQCEYKGTFKYGKYEGYGEIKYFQDGSSWKGTWVNHKEQGRGVYEDFKGKKLKGKWNNGKLDGNTMTVFPTGVKRKGFYQDGKFIDWNGEQILPVEGWYGKMKTTLTLRYWENISMSYALFNTTKITHLMQDLGKNGYYGNANAWNI